MKNKEFMNNLRILNEFGIKPTNNHVSAGMDFYVPVIEDNTINVAIEAFKQSFKVSQLDIDNILNTIRFALPNRSEAYYVNILHLYLSLDSASLDFDTTVEHSLDRIKVFIENYLIETDNIPGIKLRLNDAILINSGIRVALDHGTAGIFFNKSGKGNAGFDVRAQVVDEDYTGFVHCSLAYTKDTESKKCYVYCGDKITQMVILPVIHMDPEEISADEYYELMSNSQRGSNAFGSSDVKH